MKTKVWLTLVKKRRDNQATPPLKPGGSWELIFVKHSFRVPFFRMKRQRNRVSRVKFSHDRVTVIAILDLRFWILD